MVEGAWQARGKDVAAIVAARQADAVTVLELHEAESGDALPAFVAHADRLSAVLRDLGHSHGLGPVPAQMDDPHSGKARHQERPPQGRPASAEVVQPWLTLGFRSTGA